MPTLKSSYVDTFSGLPYGWAVYFDGDTPSPPPPNFGPLSVAQVANVLTSALEGGIRYWARVEWGVEPRPYAPPPAWLPPPWNEDSYRQGGAVAVLLGRIVWVTDIACGGAHEHHRLSLAALVDAVALLPTLAPNTLGRILAGKDDAHDGDTLVQLALFGGVIYA